MKIENTDYEIKWGRKFVKYSKIDIPIINEFRLEVDKDGEISNVSVLSFPLLTYDNQDAPIAMKIIYFRDSHKFVGNKKVSIKFVFGEVRQI